MIDALKNYMRYKIYEFIIIIVKICEYCVNYQTWPNIF
jgi:hypothetical protein